MRRILKATRYNSFITAMVVLFIFGLTYSAVAAEDVAGSDPVDRAMGHGDASEIVVARVNGVEINMVQLMGRMLDIAQKRFGRREITPILAEKIKGESLEQLVTGELAYQVAKKVVTVSAAEVEKAVVQRIKSFGGEDNFKKYMEAYQLKSRAEFSEQIRHFLVVQEYITKKIEPKIMITDAMIEDAYLGSAGATFNKPEIVQVTKIVFFLDPAEAGSYEKIKEVRNKIVTDLNSDPTELVVDGTFIVQENIKLSEASNKKLYDVARKLEKFKVSDVVESNGTLHLLQLTGYQAPVHKELAEVKGYLKNELFGRIKQALVQEWMVGLRQGADVEIVDVTR